MTVLDPKLVKVVRLWRSATIPGEKAAAKARAEEMATALGLTLDEVVAAIDAPQPSTANPFAGFDDYMEAREPGWKAAEARHRNDRRQKRLADRAAVLAKYGSADAAIAPCHLERLILNAVARWRMTQPSPHERWTDALDGWRDRLWVERAPAHIVAAIMDAYPMPVTIEEALREHAHWEMRCDEIDLAFDKTGHGLGDDMLDLPARLRAEAVRTLAAKTLPATDIQEVYARFKFYRELEYNDDEIEVALFRDIERLALTEHLPSPAVARSNPSTNTDRAGQIRAALDADPSRPDREIARACGCSPTTVGKVRRAMGLSAAPRSVRRGGQMYQASFAFEGRSS